MKEYFNISPLRYFWPHFIWVVKHLHQVSLGRVRFGSSIAGAAPESLPGLEMSLLLFLLELPGPQVEVTLLVNLKYQECHLTSPHLPPPLTGLT